MARVAALQFATGTDVGQNLATCMRMIDAAQANSPDLLVFPEFSNHISWYDDADHCWQVAVDADGEFLRTIADAAARCHCHIVINVSLRRAPGNITVSSLLYGPTGTLLGVADKQALMGHENTWFARAEQASEVIATPLGRLAMFPCRDGVTCETPRGLALRGAQLFCDSLNSFALDEASLHVPARAPENKVFLVAANKVGPLIPAHLLEAVSAQTHIPVRFLSGAGESQVVAPDGTILAKGPRDEEAVVWADIDLAQADDKRRPDGTHIFAARRPELYGELLLPAREPVAMPATQAVTVACLATNSNGVDALEELPVLVAGLKADTVLAVLPELFCYAEAPGANLDADATLAQQAIEAMRAACETRPELLLCTSLVLPVAGGCGLVGVLVGASGVVASQPQLHPSARFPWAHNGLELALIDLPWGRLALITGDDAIFPELVKLAALRGAHTIAVPCALQESWEERYGLRSRAAENRICVVASSRPFDGRAGLIADLDTDFTLMTPWQQRSFDGYINAPRVTEQSPGDGITSAVIHPDAACNKLMSERTDLLQDRPWRLSQALVESEPQGGVESSHG